MPRHCRMSRILKTLQILMCYVSCVLGQFDNEFQESQDSGFQSQSNTGGFQGGFPGQPFGSNQDQFGFNGGFATNQIQRGPDLTQPWDSQGNSRGLCPPYWNNAMPDFTKINWFDVDRRCEESWWHLYPFGERYFDTDYGLGNERLWHDKQIDLDFFLPYYGFRFNYTFIFPEGFVAFSFPRFIQPPYQFPTPQWPKYDDSSLIAAFLSPQSFMFVGDTGISHVWYRVVSRPIRLIQNRLRDEDLQRSGGISGQGVPVYKFSNGQAAFRTFGSEILKLQDGRVEDPNMLDIISRDIHDGMVGARGFTADYALIVTWERMAYGGAPKSTALHQYNEVKSYQNTYQMVVATDEVRTYVMFNYANINWTSSTAAGAFSGRGGRQSAVVGFNGGNGTGFFEMPWSAEGNSYKLVQYGATEVAGRWLARVDEAIIYGGCTNASLGVLRTHTPYGTMLGGFALNVSGPCFRSNYVIKMQIEAITVNCIYINMVKARCIIPIQSVYSIGPTEVKVSVDGGREYNFWNLFFLMPPHLAHLRVNLVDDPLDSNNNWKSYSADNLTLRWSAVNITTRPNAQIDLVLYGYWEDLRTFEFMEIGSIARSIPNTGVYSFDPRTLDNQRQDMVEDAWKKFLFGVIQVRVADDWMADTGDGIYWSRIVPFGWYHRKFWEYEYGENFPLEMCIDWYNLEGKKYSFWQELERTRSCPCTLDQASIDLGPFMPMQDCDMNGDGNCPYTSGASHCVVSVFGAADGSAQHCCYNPEGWLMFSQDHEWDIGDNYLNIYGSGTPFRAHPFGKVPYRRPPYMPSLSHYHTDYMPQDLCCNWAGRCEFYYWRRESSGCQEYQPPTTGFAYGSHFITYDGTKYNFNGKGFFVLTTMDSPMHSLMVQLRLEQPPLTLWDERPRSTVITGVACKDNNSATVEVYARKEFRRWRYKMDVYAFGGRIFFDKPHKKFHYGGGLVIYNPARALNASIIWILFETGVGVRVGEDYGVLNVMVVLPPNYNYTTKYEFDRQFSPGGGVVNLQYGDNLPLQSDFYANDNYDCEESYHTKGLLGVWDGRPRDDLVTPDCVTIPVNNQPINLQETVDIYENFGTKWRVDGERFYSLFNPRFKPIYDPLAFSDSNYRPEYNPWGRNLGNASLIVSENQIKTQCQGMQSCEYDYFLTGRRELALSTRKNELLFEGIKGSDGQKFVSCGPLQKNRGVLKFPPGDNYLDGVTVTFTCQPEFYLHGARQRSCVNGTWSPGWWAWCRTRKLEEGLKWFTGLMISLMFLLIVGGILAWCYCVNVRGHKHRARHYQTRLGPPRVVRTAASTGPPAAQKPSSASSKPPLFDVPVMEGEPIKPRLDSTKHLLSANDGAYEPAKKSSFPHTQL